MSANVSVLQVWNELSRRTSSPVQLLRDAASEARPPLVSDPVLYINETHATWGEVNESVTPLHLKFVVYNPNRTRSRSPTRLHHSMNDVTVVRSKRLASSRPASDDTRSEHRYPERESRPLVGAHLQLNQQQPLQAEQAEFP